jgi:hypothetical protein
MPLYASEPNVSRSQVSDGVSQARRLWPWVWMMLACMLMGTSTLFRLWQDRRYATGRESASSVTMFPLAQIPKDFDVWKAREGGKSTLDPEIARIAGSTDSLIRVYENKETGVFVTLLVLYGAAEQVSGHTPEVCYPAIGYGPAEDSAEVPITGTARNTRVVGEGNTTLGVFKSQVFSRKGEEASRDEVYHAFRQNGRWVPSVEGNWKTLSSDPSLLKVQVQRRVGEREQRHLENPTERFLSRLIPEIETRIAAAGASK